MKRYRSQFLYGAVAILLCLCPQLIMSESVKPDQEKAPTRIREIYVPYDKFRELTSTDKDGIIMTLKEYRKLVLRAIDNIKETKPKPGLPPVAATILTASYTGKLFDQKLQDKTVRFKASLTIRVSIDGWVRCDLGLPLPGLGRVVVDDKPGWIIVNKSPNHAHLLLKGKGEHHVDLFFSLGVREREDLSTLRGRIIPAASSSLELEVKGHVEATAQPDFLQTIQGPDSTRLVLSTGTADTFQIKWKQKKLLGEKNVFLSVKYRVNYAPRIKNPIFKWTATVKVARRKTDSLLFTEPPGTSLLALKGPLVHSWEQTSSGIKVVLKEPVIGDVNLECSGVIEKPGTQYTLGVPSLVNAYTETGYMAIYEPGNGKITVESKASLKETSRSEAGVTDVIDPSEGSGIRTRICRVYSFTSSEARITVKVTPLPVTFETQGTYMTYVTETNILMEGVTRVSVNSGRLYRLSLSIQKPWKLTFFKELNKKGTSSHDITRDLHEIETGITTVVTFGKAVTMDRPVEFQIRLELETLGEEDRAWKSKSLDIILPAISGSVRTRYDLGVTIPNSMDAMLSDMPLWRPLSPEEARRLGIVESRSNQHRNLVAALTTLLGTGNLKLELIHRPPRGEYSAVTHVLALERALRVRTDIRLTAVDRPVEALVFNLPAESEPNAVILGSGIKEIKPGKVKGERIILFTKPWLGTRQFRVEYETAIKPETDIPVPAIEVSSRIKEGYFESERFLVLQSKGPVEIKLPESRGLMHVDFDDLPDFTTSWEKGRVLTAYRFSNEKNPGTIRTTVHERAPVLRRLARELNLTTMIGKDGVSRTKAEILLAYSRDQDFKITLPEDARCLAVTVNGDPIRSVILPAGIYSKPGKNPAASTPPAGNTIAIPLPPQSYATITITYERPGRNANVRTKTNSQANGGANPKTNKDAPIISLGNYGYWTEPAPRLINIPVGETRWHVYHPAGYIFETLRNSELRAASSRTGEHYNTFAESFFKRIFSGKYPVFTTFQNKLPRGKFVHLPKLTAGELMGAEQKTNATTQDRLKPQEINKTSYTNRVRITAPLYRLLPEGLCIVATKLGGGGEIKLAYTSMKWLAFSKKTVFWSIVLLGWFLFLHGRKKTFWALIAWGLFLGTMLPFVFQWRSPFLILPACEGLMTLLLVFGIYSLGKAFAIKLFLNQKKKSTAHTHNLSSQATCFLLAVIMTGFCTMPERAEAAGKQAAVKGHLRRAEKGFVPAKGLPSDSVIIPYDPNGLPGQFGAEKKAYLPYSKFLELYKLAYPEEKKKEKTPPRDIIIGNCEYNLAITGNSCRITGLIDVNVLTDKWITLPLPFDRTQLVSVQVNGKEAGIAQKSSRSGNPLASIPFIELKGKGIRKLKFELKAPVRHEPGEYKILTGLVSDHSASLRAEFPAGAKVKLLSLDSKTPSQRPVVITKKSGKILLLADLGDSNRIELSWSFPEIKGKTGSQVESLSYSSLNMLSNGYTVERAERLRITGRKIDTVEYIVEGDWSITGVLGNNVSEWSVLKDSKGKKRLNIFFVQPVNQADLLIHGRAIMTGQGPLATLSLARAVKQETFVGIKHSKLRRFSANVLKDMRRASSQELLRTFPINKENMPDRIYHVYGTGAGEILAAENVKTSIQIDTDVVVTLEPDRLVVSARSHYKVNGPGPLQHEVLIPKYLSIRTVKSTNLRNWEVVVEKNSTRLVVNFSGRAKTGTEITWSAEQDFSSVPDSFELPPFSSIVPGGAKKQETIRWAFAANEELKLKLSGNGGRIPVSMDQAPQWIELPPLTTYRFGLRSPRNSGESSITFKVEHQSSILSASLVSFVRATENFIHVNARLTFKIRLAGRDRFKFTLPEGAELVSLESRNLQSRQVQAAPGGTAIEIILQSKTVGTHAVDVAYRLHRKRDQEMVIKPVKIFDGETRLKKVDQYVGVLQTAATFISGTSSDGLVQIDSERFPYLPEGVSAAGLKPTYRASKLDWSLSLIEEIIEIVEGPTAIIELAEMTTVVGIDGTARTCATYTVKNRNLQFLVLELPQKAKLWGVTLNGKPVAVGEASGVHGGKTGGRVLRIPVEYVGSASLNLEVTVQYEEHRLELPALRGTETLSAPRIHDTKVVETIWNLFFPDGYRLSLSGGNVREVPSSTQYAKKVQNLLDQYQKISKTIGESSSRRIQKQAQKEMSRLEQVLGDNLAELVVQNRSTTEQTQGIRIGQEALDNQWDSNDKLIAESQKVQNALHAARKMQQKKGEGKGSRSRQEQVLIDRDNFLKQTWRSGKHSSSAGQKGQIAFPKGMRGRRIDLDELTGERSFNGINEISKRVRPSQTTSVKPKAIEAGKGLKPLPESLITETAPGLEALPETQGAIPYTFLRPGGNAEITVTFTRKKAEQRLGAFIALIIIPIAFLWRKRRRRKRTI